MWKVTTQQGRCGCRGLWNGFKVEAWGEGSDLDVHTSAKVGNEAVV
jgi:hypothetical protein